MSIVFTIQWASGAELKYLCSWALRLPFHHSFFFLSLLYILLPTVLSHLVNQLFVFPQSDSRYSFILFFFLKWQYEEYM